MKDADFAPVPGAALPGSKAAGLDPWLGSAREFLTAGGPVLWILLGLSVAALSIVLLKSWQFAKLRPERNRDVCSSLRLWRKGEHRQAQAALDAGHPVSAVVVLAMRGLLTPGTDIGQLREEIDRVAFLHLNRLRALLPPSRESPP